MNLECNAKNYCQTSFIERCTPRHCKNRLSHIHLCLTKFSLVKTTKNSVILINFLVVLTKLYCRKENASETTNFKLAINKKFLQCPLISRKHLPFILQLL